MVLIVSFHSFVSTIIFKQTSHMISSKIIAYLRHLLCIISQYLVLKFLGAVPLNEDLSLSKKTTVHSLVLQLPDGKQYIARVANQKQKKKFIIEKEDCLNAKLVRY